MPTGVFDPLTNSTCSARIARSRSIQFLPCTAPVVMGLRHRMKVSAVEDNIRREELQVIREIEPRTSAGKRRSCAAQIHWSSCLGSLLGVRRQLARNWRAAFRPQSNEPQTLCRCSQAAKPWLRLSPFWDTLSLWSSLVFHILACEHESNFPVIRAAHPNATTDTELRQLPASSQCI